MANDYSTLLDKCLEIEGLISLLVQRGDRVPVRLYSLLNDKTESLLNGVKSLNASEDIDADDEIAESTIYEEKQLADEPEILPPALPEDAEESIAGPDSEYESDDDDEVAGIHAEESSSDEQSAETEVAETNPKPVKFKFSINDKFRFRRELFNFSDEEMDDALSIAGQMSSVDEIEDYFYNDLCWDPENEDVVDFMKIITGHLSESGK